MGSEFFRRMWMQARLLWWISTGHRLPLLRASLGLWLGVVLALVGVGSVEALQRGLEPLLQGAGAQLKVQPSRLKLGPVELMGTLFKWRGVSSSGLAQLRELPGVAQVWGEHWSRFPVGLSGSILGQRLYSDGALLGLPAEAVEEKHRAAFVWQEGARIPVLVPYSLFVAYNSGFAPANGFPRLTESALTGLHFEVVAGRSSFERSSGTPIRLEAELIGLTRYEDALAAVVPQAVVSWLGQRLQLEQAEEASSARVVLVPGADPEQVVVSIRGLGYGAEEVSGALRQLGLALEVLRGGVRGLSWLLMAVAVLLFVQLHALLLERRRPEWGLLWSQGVPLSLLKAGLWLELLGMGLLTGASGGWVAQGVMGVLLPSLERVLERTSGLGVTLTGQLPLRFGVELLGLALLLAGVLGQQKLEGVGRRASDPEG
ncbi:MAG: hypothetical protein ACKO6N_03715 [Myxococcota bacterium]